MWMEGSHILLTLLFLFFFLSFFCTVSRYQRPLFGFLVRRKLCWLEFLEGVGRRIARRERESRVHFVCMQTWKDNWSLCFCRPHLSLNENRFFLSVILELLVDFFPVLLLTDRAYGMCFCCDAGLLSDGFEVRHVTCE
jgi:hypothetical protein